MESPPSAQKSSISWLHSVIKDEHNLPKHFYTHNYSIRIGQYGPKSLKKQAAISYSSPSPECTEFLGPRICFLMGSVGSTAEWIEDPFSKMGVQAPLCLCLQQGHFSPAQLSPSRGSRMWQCCRDPAALHSQPQQCCLSGLHNIPIFCICLFPLLYQGKRKIKTSVHDAQTMIFPSKDLSEDFRTRKERLNA